MRIENEVKLDFKDVLLRPKRSELRTRADVDITREYHFRNSGQTWSGVPIIAANMDHTGTIAVATALAKHALLTAMGKFVSLEQWQSLKEQQPSAIDYCFISAGGREDDFSALKDIAKQIDSPFICLDVANGYSEAFVECVRRARAEFTDKTIMAGNVVTGEMVEELILSGADIVKVGIGPGSVCTTRKATGVGYPQLSAIIECADAAHGLGGHVCADGGCVVSGDVVKAFAAGADFVMLGGMLAGHDECLGEVIEQDGRHYKRFYGMSSVEAMDKHHGGVANYRASEGKSVNVPYRGPISATVSELLGGLRSACTYVGAARLKELSKRTTFVRVTQQINAAFDAHEVEPD